MNERIDEQPIDKEIREENKKINQSFLALIAEHHPGKELLDVVGDLDKCEACVGIRDWFLQLPKRKRMIANLEADKKTLRDRICQLELENTTLKDLIANPKTDDTALATPFDLFAPPSAEEKHTAELSQMKDMILT